MPLDIFIFKMVKSYICATSFKRAALKALAKAIPEDELVYLRTQFSLLEPKNGSVSLDNFRVALAKHVTDAMKESRVPDTFKFAHRLDRDRLKSQFILCSREGTPAISLTFSTYIQMTV
ncbi:hypothetical protein OIU76_022790 [Salix suchowensis]|nr:hypothetical protein OIU76_022790 [Salix suchowensis]